MLSHDLRPDLLHSLVHGQIRSLYESAAFRYASTGCISNSIAYGLFCGGVYAGVGSKLMATIVFVLVMSVGFAINRNWSFRSTGPQIREFTKYMVAYSLAYLGNIGLLSLLCDKFEMTPYLAQLVCIFVVAVFLFLCLRIWVFKSSIVTR